MNLREKLAKAKKEYETKYVVCVESIKKSPEDLSTLWNILGLGDPNGETFKLAMGLGDYKFYVICKNHEDAQAVEDNLSELEDYFTAYIV